MDFIDNNDLREWVKKSLKKSLFQKAHELAVQTGCEILLRVQDINIPESYGTQYYATHSVQKAYEHNKLQKGPGEVLVSGESGLPIARRVDRGIQFTNGTSENSLQTDDMNSDPDPELMQDPFAQDSGVSTDVDMPNLGNAESVDANEFGNHVRKDPGDKIDLTQDSDSDDSIVEVGEVNEEPNVHRELFMQESGGYAPGSNVFTHPTPYQCGICQKAFTNVQMLENHNKLEHAAGGANDGVVAMATGSSVQEQQDAIVTFKLEPNSYTCIRCQAPFNDSTLLHNHMTQCHMATISTSQLASTTQLTPQFTTATTSPARPTQVIPAAAGSPLPQITSVTSLKLMNMSSSSAPASPMMSASFVPTSPMVSASSPFHSPLSTRSLPSPLSTRSLPSSSPAASPRGSHEEDMGKERRRRTIIAADQLEQLEALYKLEAWPKKERKEQLAREIGMSNHFVNIWFQNKRARVKKMAEEEVELAFLRNEQNDGGDVSVTEPEQYLDTAKSCVTVSGSQDSANSGSRQSKENPGPIAPKFKLPVTTPATAAKRKQDLPLKQNVSPKIMCVKLPLNVAQSLSSSVAKKMPKLADETGQDSQTSGTEPEGSQRGFQERTSDTPVPVSIQMIPAAQQMKVIAQQSIQQQHQTPGDIQNPKCQQQQHSEPGQQQQQRQSREPEVRFGTNPTVKFEFPLSGNK